MLIIRNYLICSDNRLMMRFECSPKNLSIPNYEIINSRARSKECIPISAAYDLRILYIEEHGHTIVMFVDVGTHDAVY